MDEQEQKHHVSLADKYAMLEKRVHILESKLRGMSFSSPDSSIQIGGRFPNFVVKASGSSKQARQTQLS